MLRRTFGIAQLTAIFGDRNRLREREREPSKATICIRSHDLGNLLYDPSLDFGQGLLFGPIAKTQARAKDVRERVKKSVRRKCARYMFLG